MTDSDYRRKTADQAARHATAADNILDELGTPLESTRAGLSDWCQLLAQVAQAKALAVIADVLTCAVDPGGTADAISVLSIDV